MLGKWKKDTSLDIDEIREVLINLSRKRNRKRIVVWIFIVFSLLSAIIGSIYFIKRNDKCYCCDEEDYEDDDFNDYNETEENDEEDLDENSEEE
ncbi:hypothetical protein [Defluviitalea phaphyphila]|uniref:hypothetical protein n=1 Tax=Defluviitalea phaphyphila TaxID=1473580 RepID=UPI0007302F70|nr:hypothetical protein [Defluviitalea phaphyphila]